MNDKLFTLKRRMLDADIKAPELCRDTNVPLNQFHQWVNGYRIMPDEHQQALARHFGVGVDDLFPEYVGERQ